MEQGRGGESGLVAKTIAYGPIYEDIQPPSDWTQDPKSHVLLIDLPGFKKEELKVQVNNLGKLTVSGERLVSENLYQCFKQVFDMPTGSDYSNISGRFDAAAGLLYIIIAKKKSEEPKNETTESIMNQMDEEMKKADKFIKEKMRGKDEVYEQGHGAYLRSEEKEEERNSGQKEDGATLKKEKEWRGTEKGKNREEMEAMMANVTEKIRNNTGVIVLAVAIAFSIGLYISQKF